VAHRGGDKKPGFGRGDGRGTPVLKRDMGGGKTIPRVRGGQKFLYGPGHVKGSVKEDHWQWEDLGEMTIIPRGGDQLPVETEHRPRKQGSSISLAKRGLSLAVRRESTARVIAFGRSRGKERTRVPRGKGRGPSWPKKKTKSGERRKEKKNSSQRFRQGEGGIDSPAKNRRGKEKGDCPLKGMWMRYPERA